MPWTHYWLILFSFVVYCEFLAYYIILSQCKWPSLKQSNGQDDDTFEKPLHVMILADTHLLGPIKGHWLDKTYREWHMKRAFQTAVTLHQPNVIFVLGDLFDEGDMVNHKEFLTYVTRFHSHFRVPEHIALISAVGNHDVGFHYKFHPYFMKRFDQYFNNTGVNLYTIQNVNFILINSMAMQNDGCAYCDGAMRDLERMAVKLNDLKGSRGRYNRPVILQHFPTYRLSDKSCIEYDIPNIEIYRENWEVLSKNITDWLGKLLHPRLAFGGHSHHYCYLINRWGVEEYTVASFNWRNKINPSYLMVSLTTDHHAVIKCDMLDQSTVYRTYMFSISSYVAIFLYKVTKFSIKVIKGFIFS